MAGYRRCFAQITFPVREIPRGTIQAWFGSIESIPPTWRLCDGTRFTPDLRNFFIVGSGDTFNPGNQGGNVNHDHPFAFRLHAHNIPLGTGTFDGFDFSRTIEEIGGTGITDVAEHQPPFHSLAYVMYDGRLF